MRTSHYLLLIDIYLSSGFLHLPRRNSSHLSATYPATDSRRREPSNYSYGRGKGPAYYWDAISSVRTRKPFRDEGSERLATVWEDPGWIRDLSVM